MINNNLVFKSLADNGTLNLFKKIATSKIKSQQLQEESGLTRKQFYSRAGGLIRAGLVTRKAGSFRITTYGKIIFNMIRVQQKALELQFKLKAIDRIDDDIAIPDSVKMDMIVTLIPDTELQRMIIK